MEIATVETVEVETPPLPKWYTEAGLLVEDSERGRLMDEVRTALLDYPEPEVIRDIKYGCVCIWLNDENHGLAVADHLSLRGITPSKYRQHFKANPSTRLVLITLDSTTDGRVYDR